MEVTLKVRPHHADGYIIQAFEGDDEEGSYSVILKQSLEYVENGSINPDRKHDICRQSIDWLEGVEKVITNISIPLLPSDVRCGLGGVDYDLTIDGEEGALLSFSWWKELPECWKGLQEIVDKLKNCFG